MRRTILGGLLAVTIIALLLPAPGANAAPGREMLSGGWGANGNTTGPGTPLCISAKKDLKKAWKAREKARRSGNLKLFANADVRWRKAKLRKANLCSPSEGAKPTPQTASGDSRDPRPVDWTRPADGSGEPGSNGAATTVPAGCPITVSKYEIKQSAANDSLWFQYAHLENYSGTAYTFAWETTLVDADGTRVDSGGGPDAVIYAYRDNVITTLGFNVFPGFTNIDTASLRTESYTITKCEIYTGR